MCNKRFPPKKGERFFLFFFLFRHLDLFCNLFISSIILESFSVKWGFPLSNSYCRYYRSSDYFRCEQFFFFFLSGANWVKCCQNFPTFDAWPKPKNQQNNKPERKNRSKIIVIARREKSKFGFDVSPHSSHRLAKIGHILPNKSGILTFLYISKLNKMQNENIPNKFSFVWLFFNPFVVRIEMFE